MPLIRQRLQRSLLRSRKRGALRARSLAESLEHYFVEKSTPSLIESDKILQSIAPFDDWLLKSIPPNCRIPYVSLQALNSYDEIAIPAILMAPSSGNIDEIEKTAAGFLSKYSTNSGTALGCTENEALLHAINEAIERHPLYVLPITLRPDFPTQTLSALEFFLGRNLRS